MADPGAELLRLFGEGWHLLHSRGVHEWSAELAKSVVRL